MKGTVVRNIEPGLELSGRDAGEAEIARPASALHGRGRLGQETLRRYQPNYL
jgi:hypothetical protein